MSPTRAALNHPYAAVAIVLLVASMGMIGFIRTPVDLFPDKSPPQVVITTVQAGSGSEDIQDTITEVIEKEINTLSGLENIRSTSRDQVSSIVAEFKYDKDPGQAFVDVQNAIARIQANLPKDASPPTLQRLNESTARPLITLAIRPKKRSTKSLMEVRLLAENQIKDRLLGLEGVADVDVFGGHRPEVQVRISRNKLATHNISIEEVIGLLSRQNISAPAGTLYSQNSEYLVRVTGEFMDLTDIRKLPVRRDEHGLLRISDLAEVKLARQDPRSLYHGNGRKSLALGIIQPQGGATVETIERVKAFLPKLQSEFPDIAFTITQDQQPLIDINMQGMVRSITQAVLFTVAVIFIFLADPRAALTVGISLPLSFLFTLAILWLTPYTLNMVTLTGLIVATGLVVDSSVVVLENIYRRFLYRSTDTWTHLSTNSGRLS